MNIATIIGARPQFIKAATVSRLIQQSEKIIECLIHTGQHFDTNMSSLFFEELNIPEPKYNLGIHSGNHGTQTGQMLTGIEEVILKEKPDKVLVYGDTNSTLAGALVASKLHIPLFHVEAGLRSYNKNMPEEINRLLTDHISDQLFAPTTTAVNNLKKEGIYGEKVLLSGDIMYDAALFYGDKSQKNSNIIHDLQLTQKNYALLTIHRAENTNDKERLQNICNALLELSSQIPIIFPVHPRTRVALSSISMLDKLGKKIFIIDPVGYLDMIMLEKNANFILTDSGGVQKEAYFYHVPCFTIRDETEWRELVEIGANQLIKPESIIACPSKIKEFSFNENIYGEGNSASIILRHMEK